MAKRCGCASDYCSCVIVSGDGVVVSGSGSSTNPYRIDAIPGSVDLTVQNENVVVRAGVTLIDFQGDGVTATQGDPGEVIVTVTTPPGGDMTGLTVQSSTLIASGTWSKPANLLYAVVEVQGAGGGGGGVTTTNAGQASAGSGGGGGGYARKTFLAAALSASESVVVGVGGAAGAASTATATTGGDSTFHGVVGSGGIGGVGGGVLTTATTVGGNGGAATGGDLNIPGQAGEHGRVVTNVVTQFASGGRSFLGVGGRQAITAQGSSGVQGGGGSGSAIGTPATGVVGGAGGNGIVVITSYIKS